MKFADYYTQALDFLAGGKGAYAQNCTDISRHHDGEQILGQWGIAAGIYAAVRCIFD